MLLHHLFDKKNKHELLKMRSLFPLLQKFSFLKHPSSTGKRIFFYVLTFFRTLLKSFSKTCFIKLWHSPWKYLFNKKNKTLMMKNKKEQPTNSCKKVPGRNGASGFCNKNFFTKRNTVFEKK